MSDTFKGSHEAMDRYIVAQEAYGEARTAWHNAVHDPNVSNLTSDYLYQQYILASVALSECENDVYPAGKRQHDWEDYNVLAKTADFALQKLLNAECAWKAAEHDRIVAWTTYTESFANRKIT